MGDSRTLAGEAAADEARRWHGVALAWHDGGPAGPADDIRPTERAVVGFHDPGADLARRYAAWGHSGPLDLAGIASFLAGLAAAEAEAWADGRPHVATRAYAERRFLAGDRLVHWAVPWLDAAGRCYPEAREAAHTARDEILALADVLRPAPLLAGEEGRHPPGYDAYGPVSVEAPLDEVIRSVWSGGVVLRRTLESITGALVDRSGLAGMLGDQAVRADLATLYRVFAGRWRGLAGDHAGTAEIWAALSARAARTAAVLS